MSFSLRVAIADDQPAMRETLQQMLCDLGHEVVAVAEDGESLIDLCATMQPDAVITGTLTPEMHGSEAAAVIYESRPIPVILYSRHCAPDLVLSAEHRHVAMYLVKPIFQEHLQAALKECAESDEPSEDDENKVPVGPSLSPRYREPIRPPYLKLPR